MNRIIKMVLKAFSSPKIDMKEDYPLVRKLQNLFAPKPKKDYLILDRKIYSEDFSHDIPVRIFYPRKMEHSDGLLFFHGGGWVIGNIDTYTNVCINMAELTGRTVYSVDYRLAPEHPYPQGLEDCFRATEVLLDDSKLTLIGDSAGANLAAAVSLMLRDKGKAVPKKQILLYPVTYWDHSDASPFKSIRTNGVDYGLTSKKVREYMELYQPDSSLRKGPYISPLMAEDLSRQPDTLVITAQFDPLRDEGEAYGIALRKAGNRVRIHRILGAVHGFIAYPRFAKSVTEAYREINDFLNG